MDIVCLDLEGVLIPEIWVALADRTGIAELRATTRDEPDYDKLMAFRLDVLKKNALGYREVDEAAKSIDPLPGAADFMAALRAQYQVIILSDTFYELAAPVMVKLNHPTLFCHRLDVGQSGEIDGYTLRMTDHKTKAVHALQALNFRVFAAGDSFNDTGMLGAANAGFFFMAPDNVIADFPDFPPVRGYDDLLAAFADAAKA